MNKQSNQQTIQAQPNQIDMIRSSVKYEHIFNSSQFKGEYKQRDKQFYQGKFKSLNGGKPPLIPLRTKDCNKLACIFDDKPQTKVFKCCSKKQYNNNQLVLDWRLAGLMKNIERELNNPNQQWSIILLNNKIILRNDSNGLHYYEDVWLEGFGGEQPQDYQNFIQNSIKGYCYQRLRKRIKFDSQLNQAGELYGQITQNQDYKSFKKTIRDPNAFLSIKSDFFTVHKPGMSYIEIINNKTYIYLVNKNQKISFFTVQHKNNNPKQFFRNNKNEILSLSNDQIYIYTLKIFNQEKQEGILVEKLLYKISGNFGKLGNGGKIVYSAKENSLYVIGGQGAHKRFQCIKLRSDKASLNFTTINGIQKCQKCKVTLCGDGNIYIWPQGQQLKQIFNEKIFIFRFTPGKQIATTIQIPNIFKDNSFLFDDNLILSTLFFDGQPYLFLSTYNYQTKRCIALSILIQNLEKNCEIKAFQMTNCPNFSKNNWITDSIGAVFGNTTRYLAKVQNNQGIGQVKILSISKYGGLFSWKSVSY